ncbi:hypothetical protein GWI33_005606 [Rhynchophorus ferrugineus]|uniref:Uncharacterized protein n=1 Tax=Rhynchophorus ferrugineus TaxID=354439 RepID=A0A834IG51_RHYFE|nr:hypothetical protein GWI33_005606 [Rhynchophorus ferrugineus]
MKPTPTNTPIKGQDEGGTQVHLLHANNLDRILRSVIPAQIHAENKGKKVISSTRQIKPEALPALSGDSFATTSCGFQAGYRFRFFTISLAR